ncbi:MAG: histidine--tRNA ligase [Deltaproteobacteria bacterium]|nr:histidine--tRNA ligase [Deltaproteobacteria bacterium]
MPITAIRGFNDILPAEALVWRRIEETAWRIFLTYGFSEIKLPVVEKTALFSRSIGEATDIVEKEMYTFSDRSNESLTLRPEGTASVVRAYIEHKLYVAPVTRLYYTGPMFRYERPQKGRYRQFYQMGAEVLGEESPMADAETISMLMSFFKAVGVIGARLNINSLGCSSCRPAYKDALRVFLKDRVSALCDNCQRRLEANPLRALDCKGVGCIEATADAPAIIESLCASCSTHFDGLKSSLNDAGVEYAVNPRMVRGLDYYTKTTFEITADTGLGSQNAVAAGGRYDGLVEELEGPKTPCFGFAVGVERLSLLLGKDVAVKTPINVFIALGHEPRSKGSELIRGLRDKGMVVIEEFSEGALKNRMKRADRLGASRVIILGEDELKEGVVTIKDMATAAQEKVRFEELADRLGAS